MPRKLGDFGDGGAFPEIHVAQYPRNMGKPGAKGIAAPSGSIVAVDVDEQGRVRHDAIVRQGTNRDKIVHSRMNSVREKEGDKETLAAPTQDEADSTTERTRLALEKIVGGKMAGTTMEGAVSSALAKKEDEYIRYTPNPNAPGYNANAKERVVRIVEQQVDPMEPPKFKHKKTPRGPPDDPVPVLHSPPRKLTAEDHAAWKIPPCVSNWKNARGYTIPLDKRLATDGRGLIETTVSHNFATLSESLYIAERKAREETRLRGEMQKAMALKEKEAKEMELRELAARARMERAGISIPQDSRSAPQPQGDRDSGSDADEGRRSDSGDSSDDEEVAAHQREKLRADRKRDREREIRLENMKGAMKKSKMDRERDISEKIALGQLKGTGGTRSGDGLYDSRLFNQSAGMSSGFGDEEDYNLYSKPMAGQAAATSIYRPKKDDGDAFGDPEEQLKKLSDTSRFKADKGFRGTEGGSGGPRNAPVQFEKDEAEQDPFGLDAFLKDVKK